MGGIEEVGARLVVSVKQYVSEAMASVAKRFDDVDARIKSIPHGPSGKDGRDGKDADPVLIEIAVQKAVAMIPVPKDGVDGKPGSDGKPGADADPVLIEIAVQKAVAMIPVPKDGAPGEKGEDGKSVGVDDLIPVIEEMVAKSVSDQETFAREMAEEFINGLKNVA